MSSIIRATTTSGLQVAPDNSGSLQLQTNGTTTAVTIDTSQNVGIGTSSPASNNKLTVDGGRLIVANGPVGAGQTSSTKGVQTYFDATNNIGYIYSTQSGVANYRLSLNGNDIDFNQGQMRIDSSGNVLVNTTTSNAKLTVHATSGAAPLYLRVFTNGDAGIFFANASGSIQGNITVNSASVTYNSTSDYRLKENIQSMTGALDKVAQLKPVTYTWKQDGSEGQGFIAHELAEVIPDAVTGKKDAVDAEGNPAYQSVDPRMIVATLTAAIQEQQTIINDLKARIETLESK